MKSVSQKFCTLAMFGLSLLTTSALAEETKPTPVPVPSVGASVPQQAQDSGDWNIPQGGPTIVSGCYTITRGPTYDLEWTFSLSLSTDTRMLHEYYPSQCAGNFLCDVVAYRIQAFNGEWSQEYYPGVNDLALFNNTQRRMWFNFYDHNHAYTFCN